MEKFKQNKTKEEIESSMRETVQKKKTVRKKKKKINKEKENLSWSKKGGEKIIGK